MFLHVKFSDNDFAFPLQESLDDLWGYVNENNEGKTEHRNIPDMFVALDERNMLKPIIIRLWALNSIKREVEWETRGLHWEKLHDKTPNWIAINKGALPVEDTYTQYFDDMEIEFVKHHDGDHNGEHGWLDLNTGYAFNS